MNKIKKNIVRILITLLLLIIVIFFSPFSKFEGEVNMNTLNRTSKGGFRANKKVKHSETGFSFNEKKIKLDNDIKIKVLESHSSYNGFYSKMNKKISFKRVVNNDTVKTYIDAESTFWGLGKMSVRNNTFNKYIKEEIDRILATKQNIKTGLQQEIKCIAF